MFLLEELRTKSLETAFIHIFLKVGTGTRESLEKFKLHNTEL